MTTLEAAKGARQFYAYVHARPDGTPFYVGKGCGRRSRNFQERSEWHKHIVAKCGGQENILVGVYPVSSQEVALDLEKGLVKTFRRMGYKLCNLTDGGDGCTGYIHSEATRKKRADAIRGQKRSPESRAKMSACRRNISDETRAKMSAAAKKKVISTVTRERMATASTGRRHTEAAKAKISLANKNPPEAKRIKLRAAGLRGGEAVSGWRWVTNGVVNRKYPEETVVKLLAEGWRRGRK
jgi:hypothetical protein